MSVDKTMNQNEERRPNPDPSSLTTNQLLREVEHIKETIANKQDIIDTRLDGMDKGLELLQRFADKSPTTASVEQAVIHLGKLHEAALGFLKEAMSEQKTFVSKQLDDHKSLFETTTNGINSKIDDLKVRVTTIEGRTSATTEVRKDSRDNMGLIVAIAAVVIAVGLAFFKH